MFARRSVAPAVLYGIDIHVGKGETVGIVGESGSGKTTLGRALLGLVKPVAGSVIFDGRDITALDERARRPLRRRMQMIFQDPMSSLNPRHTIGRILTEPVLQSSQAAVRLSEVLLGSGDCPCGCQRGGARQIHALPSRDHAIGRKRGRSSCDRPRLECLCGGDQGMAQAASDRAARQAAH